MNRKPVMLPKPVITNADAVVLRFPVIDRTHPATRTVK